MTDLILEYGYRHRFPRVQDLVQNEITLLNTCPYPTTYFDHDVNGNFIVKSPFFDESKKVKDVYRYDLIFTDKWTLVYPGTSIDACLGAVHSGCENKNRDKEIELNKNNILVILESPHKDEYCKYCFKPIAPANSKTGENFCEYFTSHIVSQYYFLKSKLCEETRYSICFVNPVPFQTSLHFIHTNNLNVTTKALRDKVWKKLFPYCRHDFMSCIQSYRPVGILNGCTGGVKGQVISGTLKGIVKNSIPNQSSCQFKFNITHPAFWHLNVTNPQSCFSW